MSKAKLKLKKCSPCDVVKGTPGPWHDTCITKNKLEAFLLYFDEDIISKIVKRTKEPMHKICKKIYSQQKSFGMTPFLQELFKGLQCL